MEFLGILYNFITMTISIPEEKMIEIISELKQWEKRRTMTKKRLQQIMGKLQFAASCIRPGRVFINRLYDHISVMQEDIQYVITQDIKLDLSWWRRFMQVHNGVSIMWLKQRTQLGEMMTTDSCMVGAGGFCQGEYFHVKYPESVFKLATKVHIVHLEMLAVLVALRVWKDKVAGTSFVLGSDNEVVVTIINTGRSRDQLLQQMLREVTFTLVTVDAQLYMVHLRSEINEISDVLSRWYLNDKYPRRFRQL